MVNAPTVSLLVAMFNEAKYIEGCLNSILAQDYPADKLEILIMDGMSTDASWEIVSRLAAQTAAAPSAGPVVRLLSNPKRIQSAAWNLGFAASRGEIVGITSGHALLAPDYVSTAVETLQRTGADLVGGLAVIKSEGLVGETIARATRTPFGIGGASSRFTDREGPSDTVFMGMCCRRVYEQIGGFDEDMVRDQDDEFSYRLTKHGGKIWFNPRIQSTYFSRSTLGSLWKQYFNYGFYKVRVLQKHPAQMRGRQFVPPLLVGGLLFSLILGLLVPRWLGLFGLAAGSYLVANLLASIWAAKDGAWRSLLLLPLVFATLHFAYGLGFWRGLIHFANRWGDQQGQVPAWPEQQV